ncbi:MAG: UDP-N-acetylmuramoyl-L-alanine--D-glutamate ligase [Chloroflexota bacterium]
MLQDWSGKRVLIIGAARQGLALTRYISQHGAEVTLTDCRSEDQLVETVQSLAGTPVKWVVGGHPFELLDDKDLVCLSGGVPLTASIVIEAKNRQIPLSNDSQLFLEACPCRVVAITGSAGKTTTTALLANIAKKHMEMKNSGNRAWVGGNIGNPLIDQVEEIVADDIAILELSSFQLEIMSISPDVAAVLNITPNHLDRHGSMQAYTAAKARILAYQNSSDIAVLNRDDKGSWNLTRDVKANLLSFGIKAPLPYMNGTYFNNDHIFLQVNGEQIKLLPTEWIKLRGEHNLYNVLAACAIAAGASLAMPAIGQAVDDFPGVAHRLELVRSYRDIDWYNDSIATAPERTMAAIRSFDDPLVLLLGGRDKDLPWEDLAKLARQRVNHLIVFGEAADKILNTLGLPEIGGRPFTITRCEGLKQAVQAAADIAKPGDVVLLSPGGTSFDEFKDFEERGKWFQTWVMELS